MLQTQPEHDPFRGSRGPHNARVIIIGEAWGEQEERAGKPFVGASGHELMAMLKEAGINSEQCLFTNVINARPPGNIFPHFLYPQEEAKKNKWEDYKGLFPRPVLMEGLQALYELIRIVQPELIICLGNYPLWALGPDIVSIKAAPVKALKKLSYKTPAGIDTHRGSMLHYGSIPLIATYHPAGILRNWSWRHIAVQDLRRAARFLSNQLPWKDERVFEWVIRPTISQVNAWVDRFLGRAGDRRLILDLETFRGRIHIFGVKDERSCLCVPFMDVKHVLGFKEPATYPAYEKGEFVAIYMALRRLLTHPRVKLVGQNLLYDCQYLASEFAYVPVVGGDTMVAQHICFPDDRKALDFMASIHCTFYRYWKEDRKESLASDSTEDGCRYNCLDLEYTEEVWGAMQRMLHYFKFQDLMSDRMELFHIVLEMMLDGVRVDIRRKQKMGLELMGTIQEIVHWLEGAVPQHLKPPKTKTQKAPWYSSHQQLCTLLYETYRLQPVYDQKSGARTVKKEALATLAERYPHLTCLFNAITIYRSLCVFANTFVSSATDHDRRWRTSYNVAGPDTFRLSSSENVFGSGLNLQNIPREREEITLLNALDILAA